MVLSEVGPQSRCHQQQSVQECDKRALGGTLTNNNEHYICERLQHAQPLDE